MFIAVAIGTAFLMNEINNSGLDEVSRELDEPELPVVYCEYGEKTINMMKGFTQTMSTGLMRDNIVPISENASVTFLVNDESEYGTSYGYELRTIAGDSLIEDGELYGVEDERGYTRCEVSFRMDMRQNQEYILVFLIKSNDKETVRYYTRVAKLSEQYADEIIDYVSDFHSTTFVKEVNSDEGNLVYDNLTFKDNGGNLSHVNLDSPYELVSWGKLYPVVITAIVPSITEIDSDYAVIHLEYMVQTLGMSDVRYYNVDEYYSAKYNKNSEKVELLAYDRYMESIFDESYISKERNSISLGVADDTKVEFMTTEDNKKIGFVKEGQLYYYDYTTTNLVTVFSFAQGNYTDVRLTDRNLGIDIVNIDDEGNMYFAVYGYMNRGKHEGKNGISLYYFTSGDFKLSEKFFVECDEPYAVMKRETGRFTYFDDENSYFYYLLAGTIYRVNLNDMTQTTLVYGLPSDKYLVSLDKNVVVYPDNPNPEEVSSLLIHNFETGEEIICNGKTSDRLMALGFVGNDLIYGLSDRDDIVIAADGEAIMPLYKLYIISLTGEVLKEYSKDDIYILNAKVMEDKIYLERAVKVNNFFVEAEPDYISFKPEITDKKVTLTYNYDTDSTRVLDIVFPSNMYLSSSVKPIITKNRNSDDFTTLKVKSVNNANSYYIFDNSGFKGEYSSAGRAILTINEIGSGLVVDGNGNTIYRTLEATEYNTIASEIYEYPCDKISDTLMTCAYMCIEYIDGSVEYKDVMECESWEDAFAEYTYGVGINISGINLKTALYFLDRDVPFAACIDDGRFVLVISYNSTHIRYYDPIEGEEVKVTRKEFEQLLSLQGNKMYTYTSQ